jgi:hypothetical protein
MFASKTRLATENANPLMSRLVARHGKADGSIVALEASICTPLFA